MRTVQRIHWGRHGNPTVKAIQMVGEIVFNGVRWVAGSWIVMYPDKQDVVTDAQFRNRYREVEP